MKRLAGMLLCAAVALGSVAAPAKEAEMEKKIDALLQKMTLDEKIGQLNQQTGTGYSDAMVNAVKGGAVGSILNEVDPEIVNKLQKEAVENSRLGIPLVFARDVIHGFKTIFPHTAGAGCHVESCIGGTGGRALPLRRHRRWAYAGHSLRWSMCRATRVGDASPNRLERTRIFHPFWVWQW